MQKLTNHAKNEGERRESQGSWDDAEEVESQSLSAEEARLWRQRHPVTSPWRIVAWQAVAGMLAAVLTGWIGLVSGWIDSGGEALSIAGSVLYGAGAVVLPAALLARVMSRPVARHAGAAGVSLLRFFVWELVKLALAVAMMAAAPWLVPGLSWLALVGGLVVAMKAHGVAAWFEMRRMSPKAPTAPKV
ncbi:ATP synthase subunit I [Hylemonella sp. W303a]|uniref:ATP synthase subunit I n=1 Tax=Hylemonella sp. W303a TaxID=3389873 RepID=UPI00396B425D